MTTSGKGAAHQALGATHFAYLRAISEGVGVTAAAKRFLAIDHGAEALTAHRSVVERMRAVARRRGDPRWRLLGVAIQDLASPANEPTIDEWAEAEGLTDWSYAELQELYRERFGHQVESARRRQRRNNRLRESRLQMLRELEAAVGQPAYATDLLEGWLPLDLAERLRGAGLLTLGDLQQRIARGGRWWPALPAFGPVKAARLAALVRQLLGDPIDTYVWPVAIASRAFAQLSGARGANRAVTAHVGIDATDDRQAIAAWISARAGSKFTAAQYQREAERFILWCVLERQRAMSDATADDCRAYMDFLANVPERWISRRRVGRLQPGWAPFKGQLSLASQGVAIDAMNSLFGWLVQARYLAGNPWVLVNRKLGDDAQIDDDAASRAFTPRAWSALLANLAAAPQNGSTARLRWICTFVQTVGLRAAELLRATRGHLKETPAGWLIRVHGKGRRNRTVPVPSVAIAATRQYFAELGLNFDTASAETPLLTSLRDASKPVTYASLNETFTRFVRRALAASELPAVERARAMKASTHWLRHTYATRAAERNVPLDVLQENLGQADPRTTARYYRAQTERRQSAIEEAFPAG